MGRYGLTPITTLRGVAVDYDFLRACVRLWDPETHVFRFGTGWFELCPLFEEFCAIIGCDPNGPLVRNELRVGNLHLFEGLFGFSSSRARKMIVEGRVVLSSLIDSFFEADFDVPEQLLFRRRALVFCLLAGFLFNRDPGFGNLALCPLISQMESGQCIGGLVLAETFRSLDRAALGFEEWTVSPVILQVSVIAFLFLIFLLFFFFFY